MSGRLVVSLSALAENYRRLAGAARGEVAAVVKANGYGLGAAEVSARLAREGCRELFVANAEEGVRLRKALPDATIYVFEGVTAETVSVLVDAELVPVLNTPAQCAAWAPTRRAAAVHVDTGMRRLGFDYDMAAQVLTELSFPVSLFMSHFARADEPGHPSIDEQLRRAAPIAAALKAKHPAMRVSLCNSAAMLEGLGPEDLGRAGIALYGGNPYDDRANPMQPVVRLEGRVMQVRSVGAQTPVGYGGAFVTARESTLAVLGVGYADGVPRLLSNKGAVMLAGALCPIVGRVTMDLLIVDATGVEAAEGDWAEVIGANVTIDAVAAQAGTLAYEVLTRISTRVPCSYVEQSL